MDKARQIVEELADKHGISKSQAHKAVYSQFRFVRYIMEKGDAEAVRLRFFGKFDVHPKRLKKVVENSGGKGLKKKATDPSDY